MSDHDDPMADETLTDEELALLADVDALLADPAMWGGPPDGLEDRVAGEIAAARRTMAAEAPPSAAAAPASAPVTDLAEHRAKRSRVWSLLGAATAGAVAAGLVVGLIVRRDDDSTSNADRAPAEVGAGSEAPQQLTLTGSELAPGVSGSATLTAHPSGVEIALAVPGLPERSGGEFYQVWVKTCDGSLLVPAGSFHDLTDAVGWVGVSMDDFPVVTVTQEAAAAGKDVAQGTSGLIVVSGTLGSCPS